MDSRQAADSSEPDLVASALKDRSSAQLWDFYERLVAKLESERAFVFAQIENLRVPVEDAHRVEWESKQRVVDICDLELQLEVAEKRLLDQQDELINVATATDKLRAEAPQWIAELDNLRSMLCPRVDGVRYASGVPPEKIGRFVPNLPKQDVVSVTHGSSSSSGKRAAEITADPQVQQGGPNTGPTLVEYLPHDREDATEEHLKELRQRLAEEQQGHAAAKETLRNLDQIEQEENELLLTSLRQNLARVKKHRSYMQERADEVMHWHTKLQMDHEDLQTKGRLEVQQLVSCNDALSQRLKAVSSYNQQEMAQAVLHGHKLKEKASLAFISEMLQAREDTAELHGRAEMAQSRSLRNIEGLERRLSFLQERYNGLANHRTAEFTALHKDIERLQHAVAQCEKLATQCVSASFHKTHRRIPGAPRTASRGPSAATFTPPRRTGRRSASASAEKSVVPVAEALEALALRPAVRRLRKVLEKCEQKLVEERSHYHAAGGGVSSGTAGAHGNTSRPNSAASNVDSVGAEPSLPPALQ
jgi:hypothetical protein